MVKSLFITMIILSAEFAVARSLQSGEVWQHEIDENSDVMPQDELPKESQCYQFTPNQELHNGVKNEERGLVIEFSAEKRGTVLASSNSVRTDTPSPIIGDAARSVSFWFKADQYYDDGVTEQKVSHLVLMGYDGQPANGYNRSKFLIGVINNGRSVRVVNGGNIYYVDFVGAEDLRGEWHHLTITVADGGRSNSFKCYVDGVEYGDRKTYAPDGEDYSIDTYSADIIFGVSYSGLLSDFQLYASELTSDEVAQLYKNQL